MNLIDSSRYIMWLRQTWMDVRSMWSRIRKMALCLTKQGDVVYIYREDYHINDFDFKRGG